MRLPRSAMRPCDSLSRFSEASSASSSAASCRRSALICCVSTSTCAKARKRKLLFGIQRLVQLAVAARGIVTRAGEALIKSLDPIALGFGSDTRPARNWADLVAEADLAELFQRQQIGQLSDPGIELLQCLVLARDFLRQEELHHQKHRQQENDRRAPASRGHQQIPASS